MKRIIEKAVNSAAELIASFNSVSQKRLRRISAEKQIKAMRSCLQERRQKAQCC